MKAIRLKILFLSGLCSFSLGHEHNGSNKGCSNLDITEQVATITEALASLIVSCRKDRDSDKAKGLFVVVIMKLMQLIEKIVERRRLKKLEKARIQKRCVIITEEEEEKMLEEVTQEVFDSFLQAIELLERRDPI